MRITVLCINYAPEETGIAPYVTAIAEHLAQKHDVTVLTGIPHYPEWTTPQAYKMWRASSVINNVTVVRLRHFVPSYPSVLRRLIYEASWSVRALAEARSLRPELVISVVPPLLGVHAGRILARLAGARLGVVVQDVMTFAASQGGVRGARAVAGLVRALEVSGLRAADGIVSVHPKLAADLDLMVSRSTRTQVIYNWTHISKEVDESTHSYRQVFGWANDETIVMHTGNMGSKQNLELVIDAARAAARQGLPIRFVLVGSGSQRSALRDYAAGCELVEFRDPVPNDAYFALLRSADVLLVNERPGMLQMSLPSKLTSYMASGRPIVAAVDLMGATADFLRASGASLMVASGDSGAMVAAIMSLRSDNDLVLDLGSKGADFAASVLSEPAALDAYDKWVDSLMSVSNEDHVSSPVSFD